MIRQMKVPVDAVTIGERHRKDMGDLAGLARSIRDQGLLQPIGIDEENVLIYGERRFLAARDILQWPRIDARIVPIASIIRGEYAADGVRKDFTKSERLAIAQVIAVRIGFGSCDPKLARQTIDIAIKAAGFGSRGTYERVKLVHESGRQDLIDAVDKGELTPNEAQRLIKGWPKRQYAKEKLKLPPSVAKPRPKVPKPDIQRALEMLLRDLVNIAHDGGKLEAIIKEVAAINPFWRKQAAGTLRTLAMKMNELADTFYPEEAEKEIIYG